MDWAIATLAERQHGVVARRQLIEIGMGTRAIEGRIERGCLHRVFRGVYAVGCPGALPRTRWMAAVLASGDGAVLSHRSAGFAMGLLSVWSGPVEVTRPRGWRAQAGIRVHRAAIPPDETTVVDGIPTTGVFRTILDLAGILDERRLERVMAQAEVLGQTDLVSLPELLTRYPTRRGVAALRAVLADERASLGATANEFEETFRGLIASHGLPSPRFNADLVIATRHLRPDAMWSEGKLIVELDGRAAHATGRAFERDRERDRLLLAHGWRVMRVTWRQLRDEPVRIVSDLRKLLRS